MLVEDGVPEQKIEVVPLAYAPAPEALAFHRRCPARFSAVRPLRVLFLGLINCRKGLAIILTALRSLEKEPIEFHFVGPVQAEIPSALLHHPQVFWHGPVSRGETALYYRDADVFLFPTFSDGFGLTQLEARSWSLPVIASDRCGEVVQDGLNGRILKPLTPSALVNILRGFLRTPESLAALAIPWDGGTRFSLETLASTLLQRPIANA